MPTTTIYATQDDGGYSSGTNAATEFANGTFDTISATTIYTGNALLTTTYYVMNGGASFKIFGAIPYGSTINSAYIRYWHAFQGTPSQTVYPYCYDLNFGTTWSTADKMTASQLAGATMFGTSSISSPYTDKTVQYASNSHLKDRVQYYLDINSSSTSWYLRAIFADYRAEISSAPGGNNYAKMSSIRLVVDYTEPPHDPLVIDMGAIA